MMARIVKEKNNKERLRGEGGKRRKEPEGKKEEGEGGQKRDADVFKERKKRKGRDERHEECKRE